MAFTVCDYVVWKLIARHRSRDYLIEYCVICSNRALLPGTLDMNDVKYC